MKNNIKIMVFVGLVVVILGAGLFYDRVYKAKQVKEIDKTDKVTTSENTGDVAESTNTSVEPKIAEKNLPIDVDAEDGLDKIDFEEIGRKHKRVADRKLDKDFVDKVYMTVNGQEIMQSAFDELKSAKNGTGKKFSDEKIRKRLIRQAIIDQEIKKHGITVSDEEVQKLNDERMELIVKDDKMKKKIDEYLQGREMTFEEYKKASLEYSKSILLVNKLNDYLFLKGFKVKHDDDTEKSTAHSFETYLNEQIKRAEIK